MNNGITVTNVLPTEKDGEMGFSKVNQKLKDTKKRFEDVVLQKLKGL